MDADTLVMEIALGVPAVLAAAVDIGGPTSAAALGGGALKAALGSSDGAVKLVLGQDGGGALTPAVLLLHGRSKWSACLLGHALSMRRCAPPPPPPPSHSPPLLSDTAVLHALLRPHGGVDDHPPRAECKPTPPPVCSARTQHVRQAVPPLPSHADTNHDGRREVQFGAPLPSDDELLRTARAAGELYAANTSVVRARALGAPAAEWRAGDFAVRFDGCISAAAAARREGRPRCDAAFARFANLSSRRGDAASPATAAGRRRRV